MIVTALLVAALILALVEEFRSHGSDVVGWAVVLICAALLVGRLA